MSRRRWKVRAWSGAVRSAWANQPRLFGVVLFGVAFGVLGAIQGDLLIALFGSVAFLVAVGLILFGPTSELR